MKIGIDVDGVLADFTKSFVPVLVEIEPDRKDWLTLEPTDWDYSNFNMKPGTMSAAWKAVAETHNFWKELEKLPNTDILKPFCKLHDVYFITNRAFSCGDSVKDQTASWISRNYQLYYPTVIVTKDKGQVTKALGIEYFIDDNVPNCQDVARQGVKTFLQDGAWNRENTDLVRVKSLNQFAGMILAQG